MKMNKPNKSIKVKIIKSKDFDEYSTIKYDNRVLLWMEFKMRLRYNERRLSRYKLTTNEIEVIKANLQMIKTSSLDIDVGGYEFHMIKRIYEDIKMYSVPTAGYNKRALVELINFIRQIWIVRYPEYVIRKE